MIAQQWKEIGISADFKVLERNLSNLRRRNDDAQISISGNTGTEDIYVYPVGALPVRADQGWMGYAYSLWYQSDGRQGEKPTEPELQEALALLKAGPGMPEAERTDAAQRIWKLAAEQVWAIGVVGQSPAYMGIRVVSNRLENVPDRTCISQQCRTPWAARPEQWYLR